MMLESYKQAQELFLASSDPTAALNVSFLCSDACVIFVLMLCGCVYL